MSPMKWIKEILKTESKIVNRFLYQGRPATTYGFKYDGTSYNLSYIPIKVDTEDYKGNFGYSNAVNTGEMIVIIEKGHPKNKAYKKHVFNLVFKDIEQKSRAYELYKTAEGIANIVFQNTLRRYFDGKSR